MRRLAWCLMGMVAACGDSQTVPADAAAPDADFGQPRDFYPAFRPPVAAVLSYGGPTIAAPLIVPVYYTGDPLVATLADFYSKLAASPYWQQLMADYVPNAQPLTIGSPITLSGAAPAAISSDELGTLLADRLDGTHAEWGAVDAATLARTIFVFHFPSTTDGTLGTLHSCVPYGFDGYHASVAIPTSSAGARAIFATAFDCPPRPFLSTSLEELTSTISHELAEAATEPVPTMPTWSSMDVRFIPWSLQYGSEIGDMCEYISTSWVAPPDIGYEIQRSWSNTSAGDYHDPCVPIPAGEGPFFASVPVMAETDRIPIDLGGMTYMALGTTIAVGASATIDVEMLSDAPTSDDWTVEALDSDALDGKPPRLTFAFDRNSGRNGNKVHMTITVVSRPANGVALYRLRSRLGPVNKTAWWGAVGIPQ